MAGSRQQSLQQKDEWTHQNAKQVQDRCTSEGDRQRQSGADRLGEDLPQKNHQHGETNGEEGESHSADPHVFDQPSGVATEHQTAENIEAVIRNHQHRQGSAESLTELGQSPRTGNWFGLTREFD